MLGFNNIYIQYFYCMFYFYLKQKKNKIKETPKKLKHCVSLLKSRKK